MAANEGWARIAAEADFEKDPLQRGEADGELVLVCRIAGRYYAVEDRCSHDDGPLGEGFVHEGAIVCPRHGARFDIASGAALSMPAVTPIRTFPVKVEAGAVFVRVDG
jgi:3-phenylpropionate/trans-cinnamate dioxygenase ferredoxin subunit